MFTPAETENGRVLLTSVDLSAYTNPEDKIVEAQIPQPIRRKLYDAPNRAAAKQLHAAICALDHLRSLQSKYGKAPVEHIPAVAKQAAIAHLRCQKKTTSMAEYKFVYETESQRYAVSTVNLDYALQRKTGQISESCIKTHDLNKTIFTPDEDLAVFLKHAAGGQFLPVKKLEQLDGIPVMSRHCNNAVFLENENEVYYLDGPQYFPIGNAAKEERDVQGMILYELLYQLAIADFRYPMQATA